MSYAKSVLMTVQSAKLIAPYLKKDKDERDNFLDGAHAAIAYASALIGAGTAPSDALLRVLNDINDHLDF